MYTCLLSVSSEIKYQYRLLKSTAVLYNNKEMLFYEIVQILLIYCGARKPVIHSTVTSVLYTSNIIHHTYAKSTCLEQYTYNTQRGGQFSVTTILLQLYYYSCTGNTYSQIY